MFKKLREVLSAFGWFQPVRCRRCHKPLRKKADRLTGIGPVCMKKEAAGKAHQELLNIPTENPFAN